MYTVLIDEAGDVGLKGVLPDPSFGPTQYFCVCATIINEENRQDIENALKALPFHKDILHASRLTHFEKVFLGRTISGLPLGMLGAISNKLSLLEYLPDATKTPTHFYNKVMQYLLERVGAALGRFGISAEKVSIRLEARSQQYSSLISFVESIQKSPFDPRAIPIRNIDRFSISTIKKADDICMAVSDFGANSLFSAVRRDGKAFGLSETRYLHECRNVFLASRDGKLVGGGIKAIHSINDLAVSPESAAFFQTLSNDRKEYWKL